MKQEYISPIAKVIKFESTDIICESEIVVEPVAETLDTFGTSLGTLTASDLMK